MQFVRIGYSNYIRRHFKVHNLTRVKCKLTETKRKREEGELELSKLIKLFLRGKFRRS